MSFPIIGVPGPGIRNSSYYCQYIKGQINAWTDLRTSRLPFPYLSCGKICYNFNN
uniref:Uncharacterized protein n=2 Tax=Cercopithecinae TaxID=9528 RepID=Q9GMR1_MACFA|nr:hypothetical protein [Macaca fascicularis]